MTNSVHSVQLWRLQHSSHVDNDTDQVGEMTSAQSVTNSDSSSNKAGTRDEQTSLPTAYVEHIKHIVESYDRWSDADRLLNTGGGLYCRILVFHHISHSFLYIFEIFENFRHGRPIAIPSPIANHNFAVIAVCSVLVIW